MWKACSRKAPMGSISIRRKFYTYLCIPSHLKQGWLDKVIPDNHFRFFYPIPCLLSQKSFLPSAPIFSSLGACPLHEVLNKSLFASPKPSTLIIKINLLAVLYTENAYYKTMVSPNIKKWFHLVIVSCALRFKYCPISLSLVELLLQEITWTPLTLQEALPMTPEAWETCTDS